MIAWDTSPKYKHANMGSSNCCKQTNEHTTIYYCSGWIITKPLGILSFIINRVSLSVIVCVTRQLSFEIDFSGIDIIVDVNVCRWAKYILDDTSHLLKKKTILAKMYPPKGWNNLFLYILQIHFIDF